MKKKSDLKNRTTIISAIVFLLFISSLIYFNASNRKNITEQNREYLIDNATQIAQSVNTAISDGYANSKMLTDLVSDSLTGPEFDVTVVQRYVRNSMFDFVEFADNDGMNHNISGSISDARERPYYTDAQRGNSGMDLVYVSRAGLETLLMFYSPLYYNEEFVGSLVGVYQASNRLTELLSADYFGETAKTYFVSDDGRIIASNQGLKPREQLSITDIISEEGLEETFKNAFKTDKMTLFPIEGNKTGGCIVKVPDFDGYIVQVFPAVASEAMINDAIHLGYEVIFFLIVIGVILFISLRKFYLNQQKLLEKSKNLTEESLVFTNHFLNSYVSAYHVNLDNYSYEVYKRSEELEEKYPKVDNFYFSVDKYINECVHPDDREGLKKFIKPENIKKILKNHNEYNYIFRDISNGIEKTYRLKVICGKNKNKVAFGFKDVSKEIKEQKKYLLGAIPLSPDVLSKANIGMWSFELDEGKEPRMYVDNAMLGLIGLDHQISPEETYHAWYDHIDEGSLDLVAQSVDKMISGEHAEVQYPWHHPDGHTMVVRCGGVRNYEYTQGVRIEGTHQNVTAVLHFNEEKRTKEKNDLSLMLITSLSDSYTTLYYIDAETGVYQLISENKEYERDVQSKVLNGGNFYIDTKDSVPFVICEEDREKLSVLFSKENIENAFGDNKSFKVDYRIQIGEKKVWHRVKAVKLRDSDNRINYAVGVMNIENELKMQMELHEALEAAEAANKAKTTFLFNMSHDIRTPMNAIVGFTNIAQKHIDDKERVVDSLEKTKQASELLLALINSILDMSRIESGKAVVEQDEGDVYQSFSAIESTMNELAKTKDIDLSFKVENIRNRYVYYDHNRCVRVFVNIISNAIKYTPNGGRVLAKCEQISSNDDIGIYRYTFTDNGIGMSEEFQKHVFDEFSREQNSTISGIQGTGLGLTVCKSFVELMGGTISCESKQGVGTTFTVILPIRLREVEQNQLAVSEKVEQSEEYNFNGKKILLVEDNMLNREIATDILEDEGIIVENAENGSVAVEMLREKGADYYDFILMDIQMPVMNGYEATKAIRAMYPNSNIKIIALSANAFAEDKAISIAAGMNDHVAKPINIGSLLEALQNLI